MLNGILLTILIIVCLALGALVLLQRSEGGALGIGGGGPSGFMSARGAGNLLTRATSILGIAFFALCLAMGVLAQLDSRRGSALEKLDTSGLTVTTPAPTQEAPAAATVTSSAPSIADIPLAGAAPAVTPAPAPSSAAPAASSPAAAPASSATTSSPAQ